MRVAGFVCVCPQEAISMQRHMSGHWFISHTRSGYMTHAKLGIAEENSGKLVTLVRQQAKLIAERENKSYVIIDGPSGIGCTVIEFSCGEVTEEVTKMWGKVNHRLKGH